MPTVAAKNRITQSSAAKSRGPGTLPASAMLTAARDVKENISIEAAADL